MFSKYQTTRARAINLGIYGTDINYASMFNQTQETLFYVKCAKTLANNLGVMNAFDKETLDRIEGNIDQAGGPAGEGCGEGNRNR